MKIEKIKIENFKGIKTKEIIPEKINVLLGKNGTGKTSTVSAIKYFLTNDKTGKEELMRIGSTDTSVTCDLPNDVEMVRGIKQGSSSTGKVSQTSYCKVVSKKFDESLYLTKKNKTVTTDAFNEYLEEETGVNINTSKIVSASDILDRFEPAELGSMLLSYIPEELDFDTIASVAGLSNEMIDTLELYIPPMPTKFGLEVINSAAKAISDEQSVINKLKASATAKSIYNGPEIKRKVEDIDLEIENLLKKEGASKNQTVALNLYNNAIKSKEAHEEKIRILKEKISLITANRPNPANKIKVENALLENRKKLLEITKLIQNITTSNQLFLDTLKNLDKSVCPISEKLICTTDKKMLKEELTDLVQANKEGIEYQETEKKIILEAIEKEEKWIKVYDSEEKKYQEKLNYLSQLNDAEANLKSIIIPEKPNIEKIDFVSAINDLKREKVNAEQYNEALNNKKIAENLTMKYKLYQTLAKALKPKGIIYDYIMDHYSTLFHDDIAERSKYYNPDYDIKFISDNGMQVWCKVDKDSDYVQYYSLSTGEKAVVSFFVLDMLSRLSKFKILLLDGFETLDEQSFSKIVSLLNKKEITDPYDHIFLAAVNHEDTVKHVSTLKNAKLI